MDLIEIAQKAKELISDPKRWTQGVNARDECAVEVHPKEPTAVCWCAWGALVKFVELDSTQLRNISRAAFVANNDQLFMINDDGEHDDIMAAFDKTISYLDGKTKEDIDREYEARWMEMTGIPL